jgi:intergrase/recombinase
MLQDFLNEYGNMIISTIITAILGAVGVFIRNIYKRLADDKTKRKAVRDCVLAVEQLHKDLHGTEKYNQCFEYVVELLEEKGIPITEMEVKMLIEAEVKKMNDWLYSDEELQ